MNFREERLPHEDAADSASDAKKDDGAKTVRITITSHHDIPAHVEEQLSMFCNNAAEYDDDYDEEEYDDAEEFEEGIYRLYNDLMSEDGDDIGENDNDDIEDDFDDDDDLDYEETELTEAQKAKLEEMFRRVDDYIEHLSEEERLKEENTTVLKSLGKMRRGKDNAGRETIEIVYDEDSSMDNANTTIVYTPSQNDLISIHHDGAGIMSCLVFERGVRHISSYVTPIMPLEMAVYTGHCDANLSFENGGCVELDYLVEFRGMDLQRTKISIDVVCLD